MGLFAVNYVMDVKLEEQDRDVMNATFKIGARKAGLSVPTGGFPGC